LQGYVMLARSGGQGGGRPLAGRGVSPPKLFLSGGGGENYIALDALLAG